MLKWIKHIKRIKNNYDFYANVCGHKKSFVAKVADLGFLCIIIVLSLFLLGTAIAESIILPFLFSLTLLIILTILLYTYLKRDYLKLQTLAYDKILLEEIEKQLYHISLDDFRSLLIKLLLDNNIFSHIVVGKNMIEGIKDKTRYAIGYSIVNSQEAISWDIVETFITSVQYQNYKNIIFFTNAHFEERCHSLKGSFQDFTIYLMEKEHIVNLVMSSTLVPSQIELERKLEYIIRKKYNYMKQITKAKKGNILPVKKIKSLLIYSFIFIVLAFLSETYLIYYSVVSGIFLILAIITALLNKDENKSSENILEITKEVDL